MNNKNLLIGLAILGGGVLVFLLSKKNKMTTMPSSNPAKPNTSTSATRKTALHSPPRPQLGFPIQRGSRGPAVKKLQQALKSKGYNPGPLDGAWGAKTSSALIAALDSDAPIRNEGELNGVIAQMTYN